MNHFSPLDPNALQVVTNEEISEQFYQVRGDEISWTRVQDKNSATFSTDSNSHKYTFLGIYSESDALRYTIDKVDGGLNKTMLEDIYTAYNSTGLWVGSLASSSYRASVHPNFKLTIPISGGTGTLSGLTSLDIYSSFIRQNDSTSPDGGGSCSCWLVDSLKSESMSEATYMAGIGYAYDPPNNPGQNTMGIYRSGTIFLFANEIYFSGNTGTTWDTGWSAATKYTYGNGSLAEFSGPTRNKAVGVMHLDSGLITLWNPDIVSSFNESVATGGTATSGLTFSTSDCSMGIRDIDLTTKLNINTPLYPQTYGTSTNKSLLDARAAGVDCGDKVSITRLCYYDPQGMLVAVATVDEPIEKGINEFAMIQASLTLDGGIQTPSDETHVTLGYPSGL